MRASTKKKGFTDIVFMFTFAAFLVFFVFITSQLSPYGVPSMSALDLGFLGGEMIAIGVACAVITGLACVATTVVAVVLNFFIIPPIYLAVFTPFLFVFAYIIAKLTRGN
jgi:hypothetical protein